MASERVRFPGSRGVQLAARLDRPTMAPRAWALFAHCFTCSKDLRSIRTLSRALSDQGIAVLRFDFTGLGESEGDFADTNFSSNLEDLRLAVDYLRRDHEAPSLLIGHSLGGAAVLAVAQDVPEAKAVVTLGAPADVRHLQTSALATADPEAEESEVQIAGRSFRVRRQLFEDLEQHRLLDAVAKMRCALLLMHSPVDEVVDVDNARRLFEAAKHPKSFVSLEGADHLLLRHGEDAPYAAAVIAAWVSRYVGGTVANEEPLDAATVEVSGGNHGFRHLVRTRHHRWIADEPTDVGGSDQGPSPYEQLLGGLGSCMAMTLRMYADRKEIPLEGVRVRLRHGRIHAKDCAECETNVGLIDRIEKELEIYGDDLTDAQRVRLVEISEKCPVHRTLTTETRIVSSGH